MRSLLKLLAVLFAFAGLALFAASRFLEGPEPLGPRDGLALADAKIWGYQLQRLKADLIPNEVELLVTDYSRDGTRAGVWTAEDIATLRRRPDGRPRIVLAYMSIGEAENYRGYWRPHWQAIAPSWIGPENKDWKGNFAVRYWQPGWQKVIVNPAPSVIQRLGERWLPSMFPRPYLDLVLEAGFDGVYLDKVDGFEDWQSERPEAADDMIAFVAAISRYGKARRPGFLIVPQNGEALLEKRSYLAVIDGIAKEDLQYGANSDGTQNTPDDVASAALALNLAIIAGLPVYQVEYVRDPALRLMIQKEAQRLGYRVLFANRELNLPPERVEQLPEAEALSIDAAKQGSGPIPTLSPADGQRAPGLAPVRVP